MFKRILFGIILTLIFCNVGWAGFLGTKQASENVYFSLKPPLDSAFGIDRKPDSVHVFTYADGDMKYSVRSATYPFTAAGVDTIKHQGDTVYKFFDVIADIDGTAGNFLLDISVALFYDEVPTWTFATVQIIKDSLNERFDNTIDSVIIDVSSALVTDGLLAVAADSNWEELLTGGTHNTQNSAGKILRQIKGGSVIHDGTSDNVPANGANSFSLETGGGSPITSTTDNFYNHQRLAIVEGTGEAQVVIISDYNGTNQVATVTPAFLTTPDATSVYEILPGLVHAETQGGGYEGGAVWVSSSGSAGTQLYVDGTIDNPIDDGSFANAKTVADALNITTFKILTGSQITLAATYNNYNFEGMGWHLALGNQDLGHSNIHGAEVSGTATGSNVIQFFDCLMDSLTISPTNFFRCGFGETVDSVTASAAGTYIFRDCYSIISGTATPKFSLGDAVANVNFGFRNYDGGMELSEIGSLGNDSVSIEGNGNLILNASNVGGDLVIRGNFTITDNSSTVTVTRDAALNGEYLTDLNWDEVLNASDHNVGSSSGQRLRLLETATVIRSNTAQGPYGANNRIQLDAGASATDGAYDPAAITIVGNTGEGQTRLILQYDGTNKVCIVDRNWKVNPDATSEFIITSHAGREHVNEGEAQGGGSNTITLNALASSSDSAYVGHTVFLRAGTGEDQAGTIVDYNGTSKVATISKDWYVIPDTSTAYVMLPTGLLDLAAYAVEIATATWRRNIPDDTTAGAGDDMRAADLLFRSGDTVNWANPIDFYQNIDTAGMQDTSDIIQKVSEIMYAYYLLTGMSIHSAADIWTESGRELSTPNNYKADVSALALEATLATVDGIVDLILTYTDGDGSDGIDANIDLIRDSLQHLVTATSLTSLGFDLDSADFANHTFPTWLFTTEFFDSAQGAASGLAATDFWNVPYTTGFASGSMGDTFKVPLYFQGAAAGLSATEIMDSIRAFPVSDTLTGKYFSQLIRQLELIYDSTNAYDDWIAKEVTALKSLDSLSKILDTLYLYDTRWDSILTAVTDANMGDKMWVDAATRALTELGFNLDSSDFNDDTFRGIHFGDSYWDSLGNRSGSDTTAILAMMENNLFAKNTDSLLTKNVIELARIFAREIWSIAGPDDTTYANGTMGKDAEGWDLTGASGGIDSIVMSNMLRRVIFGIAVGNGDDSTTLAQRLVVSASSGGGAFTINYYLLDSSNGDTVPVQQAPVWANNFAQTAIPYFDLTDNNGLATFNLDADSWVFFHTAAGLAPYLDSNVISGTLTDTLWTYTGNANKAVVYGTLIDPRGQRYDGALVMFRLFAVPEDSLLTFNDSLVMSEITFDTADVNGQFEIPIYANENLSDSSYYRVTFQDKLGNYIDKYAWNVWVNDTTRVSFNALGRWRD